MKSYNTILIQRKFIAENTLELSFQRPEHFIYQAGQHINIKMTRPLYEDKKGGRRTFTIASAPHEEHLIFSTRVSTSGFKKSLLECDIGSTFEVIGPMGKMVFDQSKPAVFIAGGIGITPFRSMTLDIIKQKTKTPATLLFSNRLIIGAPYHELFVELNQENSETFIYIPTITDEDDRNRSWDGENRKIDSKFIEDYVFDIMSSKFYLCGPPNMVTHMNEILTKLKIAPELILTESFFGY